MLLYLLREIVFRALERSTPFLPESDEQGLENPRKRRGEKRSNNPKEFGSRDQRGQRDNGMQANRFADDAWSQHVTLKYMNDDKVGQYDDSHNPSLRQGKQHADRSRNQRSQHRNKLEQERQHSQQEGKWYADDLHPDPHEVANQAAQQDLATNIATHDMLERIQEKFCSPLLPLRHVPA